MKKEIVFFTAAFFTLCSALAAPSPDEGKAIFNSRCASCHNINKTLAGPALAGVEERRKKDWIISFVQSSQSMIKAGDADAVALFNQFNKMPMPDHRDLTAENIESVLAYIDSEKTTAESAAPFRKPIKIRPNYTPLSFSDYRIFIGFLAAVGLLVMALLFAVQVKTFERNINRLEDEAG